MNKSQPLQKLIGEFGDFFAWIADIMQTKRAQEEVMHDLGLDPEKTKLPFELPPDPDSIDRYRFSANIQPVKDHLLRRAILNELGLNPENAILPQLPGKLSGIKAYVEDAKKENFLKALKDIGDCYDGLKTFTDVLGPGLLHCFLNMMAVNYFRLHHPRIYWAAQVAGFLEDAAMTHVSGDTYWNRWENLFKGIGKNLKKFKSSLDTEEETKEWSDSWLLTIAIGLTVLKVSNFLSTKCLVSQVCPCKVEGELFRILYGKEHPPNCIPSWADRVAERTLSFDMAVTESTRLGCSLAFIPRVKPEVLFELKLQKQSDVEAVRTGLDNKTIPADLRNTFASKNIVLLEEKENFEIKQTGNVWLINGTVTEHNDPKERKYAILKEAHYKISDNVLENPELINICNQLQSLKDQIFTTESSLIASLKRILVNEPDEKIIAQILASAFTDGKLTIHELQDNPGLYMSLNGEKEIEIPLNDDWDLTFNLSSNNVLGFIIWFWDIPSFDSAITKAKLKVGIANKVDPETGKTWIFPDRSGTRIEIGPVSADGFLSRNNDMNDAGIEFTLKDCALVLGGDDVDGFLAKVLPSKEKTFPFNFGLGASKERGFYLTKDGQWLGNIPFLEKFKKSEPKSPNANATSTMLMAASAGEIAATDNLDEISSFDDGNDSYGIFMTIPIGKSLGPFGLQSITLGLLPAANTEAQGISAEVSADIDLTLGPVYALVQRVGFCFDLTFPEEGGNLVFADLDYGFKPPSGVALKVNSDVVTGGGFLEFDSENHRYAGVLALNLKTLDIELTAIGLISTRLPNNQKGFSMLICLNVLFDPAFQLAFGFTLEGVGGLLGIHRTMKTDVLKEKIKNGAIDSIMFPKDVIENAPRIISDLRAVFPPKENHYVFAPLLKIGWGTPSTVEIDLAVLAELPFKDRLLLIGHLGIYLPDKEKADRLVEIHIDVFGDFNFGESYVSIEGRLRDSKVVGISLQGGFAFVLDWCQTPQFLLSIGGYHPRYKKPARFPAVERLTALIRKGNNLTFTCQYYQAITSNSFQIGFQADLLIKYGSVSVTGFLDFNALIQFDPFQFETDIHISVDVRYKSKSFAGVELSFLLTGPEPWHAKGYAKIKIWFFSLKVKFNYTWGGEQEIAPSTIDASTLLEKLEKNLRENRNWTGKLPSKFQTAAALRSAEDCNAAGMVLVHPMGHLEVRQTVVPLNWTIEKFGNSYVENSPKFRIVSYQLGDDADSINVNDDNQTLEYFSRGQYRDLTDEEKISTPDFDLMAAGISLGSDAASDLYDFSDEMESTVSDFEDIILPKEESQPGVNWQALSWTRQSIHRRGMKSDRPSRAFWMIDDLSVFEERGYKIVSKDNLEALKEPDQLTDKFFKTYTAAEDYLKSKLLKEKEKWQIVEA